MLLTIALIALLSVVMTPVGEKIIVYILERNRSVLAEYGMEPGRVCGRLVLGAGAFAALFLGIIVPESATGKVLSAFLLYWLWLIWLIDYRFQFIFDDSLLPLALAALVAQNVLPTGFVERLAVAAGTFALLALLSILSGGALGGGDAKLMAVLGLWFGLHGTVNAACAGFILGGVAALVLLALGRRGRKDYFAFGPYLILGALVAWMQQVLLWK